MSEERQTHRVLTKFKFNDKIIEKAGGARIYRDTTLLTPGSWSDSLGMSEVEYTPEELKKSAKHWDANYLNIDHNWGVLSRIGHIENTHWSDNAVKGDLYIYPITNTSRDTIALIDAKLINELSVELMSRDVWKSEDTKRYATEITYMGAAVVTMGACRETKIQEDDTYKRIK